MVTIRSRGENVAQTESVELRALFRGPDGLPADLDAFPTVTIVQPSGNVAVAPTSVGVFRLDTGLYGYVFAVGINDSVGVWNDIWDGILNGFSASGSFNFVVQNTQLPAVNTDGFFHLGDDPGFCYSQTAIMNINKCMKLLKARLNSAGKSKSTDEFGNKVFVDCDIFDVDSLASFLQLSLDMFNEIPHFTCFTFDDSEITSHFQAIIVQGASLVALSSKALIERGREFTITDAGVSFVPPTVSELLNNQWNTSLVNHLEKLKIIKSSMKPGPFGLGTLTISTTRHPAVARLRHLRARQLF